jgi:hypothetical protein
VRKTTDVPARERRHDGSTMRKSYGVVWRSGDGPLVVGKLGVQPLGFELDGLLDGEPRRDYVAYEELTEARVGRGAEERISGRATVVLERQSGPPLLVSTVAQPSLVGEIVEGLAALQLGTQATRRTALVVPIDPMHHAAVCELVAAGPPFDPRAIAGLLRHEVFVSAHEAVFVFETESGVEALDALLEDPTLWRSAAAWHAHAAGPPRLATAGFSWSAHGLPLDPAIAPR